MSKPFNEVFLERLDNIEKRAHACEPPLTLTHICRNAGIARATPDRWRKKPPKSIELLERMETVVADAEKAAPSEK
ncbi:MAG: hypothetical protein AB7E55_30440 [Pigmentiphaga sp.]